MNIYNLKQNEIFHVHTYRCTHASMESDEEYILKAIEMGSKKITFTDHAPFPNDPFYSRMKYSELDEYIYTLNKLKQKYNDLIDIYIGLEIEYLPSYHSYYADLLNKVDILVLGEHIFEITNNIFNFDINMSNHEKAIGVAQAIIQGIQTGYFKVVAHPDRFFLNKWCTEYDRLSIELINTAKEKNVMLEYNLTSLNTMQLHHQFWNLVDDKQPIIIGTDAHSTYDLLMMKDYII